MPADYDGDGKADLSVKNNAGEWKIDYASNGFGAFDETHRMYGGSDAHPVPADYNGDGIADLSVKTNDGKWFIDFSGYNVEELPQAMVPPDYKVFNKSLESYVEDSNNAITVYPNPFNSSTNIQVTLNDESLVEINAYDILGRNVKTIDRTNLTKGTHSFIFDGSRLTSGIYYLVININHKSIIRRISLIK